MGKYAADTDVSTDRSLAEIKGTLLRYGAAKFAYLEEEERAAVAFEFHGRRVRFIVPLPRKADEFVYSRVNQHSSRTVRDVSKQHELWEKACRQRWRALSLAVKAKLEVVESGIATFEEEFLSYVVLPNGQTVGEYLTPQLAASYESGRMPPLLPGVGETS